MLRISSIKRRSTLRITRRNSREKRKITKSKSLVLQVKRGLLLRSEKV